MENINRELLDFIEKSPTAWHAAANVAAELERAGYTRLYEEEDWQLRAPGKYYAVRNGSAVIALNLPEGADGFLIMAAHDDSPTFRVKAEGEEKALGIYSRLAVEKYGGMLCSTWLDRPLSLAGRVAVREEGGVTMKLVNIDRDLLVIPNLAIHMDRSANEGKNFNVNVDMIPLIGSAESKTGLNALIAESLGVKEEDIVSRELNLYPRTPGTVWGAENEFISAPRLDDLQCAFGCLKGFLQADKPKKATVLCVFDNEEVGSGTRQGADAAFLVDEKAVFVVTVHKLQRISVKGAEKVGIINRGNNPSYAQRLCQILVHTEKIATASADVYFTTVDFLSLFKVGKDFFRLFIDSHKLAKLLDFVDFFRKLLLLGGVFGLFCRLAAVPFPDYIVDFLIPEVDADTLNRADFFQIFRNIGIGDINRLNALGQLCGYGAFIVRLLRRGIIKGGEIVIGKGISRNSGG